MQTTIGIVGLPHSIVVGSAVLRCQRATAATVTQTDAGSVAEAQRALDAMAVRKIDEIVAIGPWAAHPLWVTARTYPHSHFAEIGAVVQQPNVTSVLFRDDEGAYLAGAFAAVAASGKPIAFVGERGGEAVPSERRGFEAGARAADPKAVVIRRDVAPADRGAYRDALAAARASGVAAAYVATGDGGGALYAFGLGPGGEVRVGDDKSAPAAPRFVFNVSRSEPAAVQRICENAASQKPVSGVLRLGVAEGAIAVGGTESALAPAGRARFDAIRDAFATRRPAQTPAPG